MKSSHIPRTEAQPFWSYWNEGSSLPLGPLSASSYSPSHGSLPSLQQSFASCERKQFFLSMWAFGCKVWGSRLTLEGHISGIFPFLGSSHIWGLRKAGTAKLVKGTCWLFVLSWYLVVLCSCVICWLLVSWNLESFHSGLLLFGGKKKWIRSSLVLCCVLLPFKIDINSLLVPNHLSY